MTCLSCIKNIFKNILALVIGLGLALVCAEALIRIFFYAPFPMGSISALKDMEIGYRLAPNQRSFFRSSCFDIYPVNTNSYGFRDSEWRRDASFKIAVLGDSLMHAREVGETEYTSAILEKLINLEVLNSGVSGYGSITEYLVYEKYLAPMNPDLIILFFTPANDVANNHCGLTRIVETKTLYQACGNVMDGNLEIDYSFRAEDSGPPKESFVKKMLKSYCVTCVSANELIKRYVNGISYNFAYDVFMPPKVVEWEDAWKITEKILVKLDNKVRSNNGKLIIVPFPDYMMISQNWKDQLLEQKRFKEIPPDFDPFYPVERLQAFAKKNNINFFRMEPDFLAYRAKFNLKPPYFYYSCDGHPNPVGHFLAANLVAKYLIENNFIPTSGVDSKKELENISKNLNLSPREILGDNAYQQIYNAGLYRGLSNVQKLIN